MTLVRETDIRLSNAADTDDENIVTWAVVLIGVTLSSDCFLIGRIVVTNEVD